MCFYYRHNKTNDLPTHCSLKRIKLSVQNKMVLHLAHIKLKRAENIVFFGVFTKPSFGPYIFIFKLAYLYGILMILYKAHDNLRVTIIAQMGDKKKKNSKH